MSCRAVASDTVIRSKNDCAIRFNLATDFNDLLHNAIKILVVCVDGHTLSHKIDAGGIDAFDFLNGTFHFCGAVCAIEIFKFVNLFHSRYSFSIVICPSHLSEFSSNLV